MKKFIALAFAIIISANLSATNTLNLMPYPSNVKVGEGKFTVDRNLRISMQGQYNSRLTPNVGRFVQRLSKRTTITLDRDTIISNQANATFAIKVNRPGTVKLGEDESYRLVIDSTRITLSAFKINFGSAFSGLRFFRLIARPNFFIIGTLCVSTNSINVPSGSSM